MRYVIDNDMHIHTNISICSTDPNQTPESILKYAQKYNLKTVVIADHFWDERVEGLRPHYYGIQNFEHISKALPLPQVDGVRLLFGCEADVNADNVIGVHESRFDDFGFIVIPTTHWHLRDIIRDEVKPSNELRVKTWFEKIDALLNSNLPLHKTGLAHMLCRPIARSKAEYPMFLNMLPSNELERVFTTAAVKGLGIEINAGDMMYDPEEEDAVLRIFKTAKGCGCKFYLGSDAHKLEDFENAIPMFEKAIDKLGLEEKDKFILE